MARLADNVIPFPLNRRPPMRGCPQCGGRSDVLPVGRVLWGYCEEHETRWVVVERGADGKPGLDRRRLRLCLARIASFVEVSH